MKDKLVIDEINKIADQRILVSRLREEGYKLIPFFKSLSEGYTFGIAVDFSEIFGFCFPIESQLTGFQSSELIDRARLADLFLFTKTNDTIILLSPHLEELWRKIDEITSKAFMDSLNEDQEKLLGDQLDSLRKHSGLSNQLNELFKQRREINLEAFTEFIKENFKKTSSILHLMMGGYSNGVKKVSKLISTKKLKTLSDIFPLEEKDFLTEEVKLRGFAMGREFAKLNQKQSGDKKLTHSNYNDGLALSILEEVNEVSMQNRVFYVLFSRDLRFEHVAKRDLDVKVQTIKEMMNVPIIWNPDTLLAYEVFKGKLWAWSAFSVESFCKAATNFLEGSEIESLRKSQEPIETIRKVSAYLDDYANYLDDFENIRLATFDEKEISWMNEEIISGTAKDINEGETVSYILGLHKLIGEENIRKVLKEETIRLLRNTDNFTKALDISDLLGSKKSLETFLSHFEVEEVNDENLTIIRCRISDVDIELKFYSSHVRQAARRIYKKKGKKISAVYDQLSRLFRENQHNDPESLLFAAFFKSNHARNDAISIVEEALQNTQNLKVLAEAHFFMGFLLSFIDAKLEESITHIEHALHISPEESRYWYKKGFVQWRRGLEVKDRRYFFEAIEFARTALKHGDGSDTVLVRTSNDVAYMYIETIEHFKDDLSKGDIRNIIRKCLLELENFKIIPEKEWHAEYFHTLGKFHMIQGNLAKRKSKIQENYQSARERFMQAWEKGVSPWTRAELQADWFILSNMK